MGDGNHAKLASDMGKPDGLTVVPRSRDALIRFPAPLPVDRIWGVGKVMRRRLLDAGIATIARLQEVHEKELASTVGRHSARHLRRLAFGEDAREIELDREEKSFSREYTFPADCRSPDRVRQILLDPADDVGGRLREAGKYAGLARLKLRWQSFATITRQTALPRPLQDDFSLRAAAKALFDSVEMVKPVRLVGFGVGQLVEHAAEQLGLFGEQTSAHERHERLSRTVDAIRRQLGRDSIGRGSRGAPER